jgi:hypothetical protein
MKKVSVILSAAMIFSLVPAVASAQFKPDSGEIKGYMIGEYYYNIDHHTGSSDDGGFKGRHGFWFRRIYFTYNNKLSDTVKMRLRLEMNSNGKFESSTLGPVVKDAYLSFSMGGGASLVAGIQGPPSFSQVEDVWGYRSLEKTPLDLQKWTSSRDFGISLKGGETVTYHFMLGQGSSNKGEDNNGKKLFGAVGYNTGGFFGEVMAQFESDDGAEDFIGQVFGSYSGDWGRFGAHYSMRSYKSDGADDSLGATILSAFAVIKAGDKAEVIARYDKNFGDWYEQKFKGSGISYVPFANYHSNSFFIGAVSYQVHKNVWLIPNIKYTIYDENDLFEETPGNDVYGNLTLWFKF